MKDLNDLYKSFETGIRSAVKPKQHLKEVGLDSGILRIGYNSAQFHHGKPQELKDHYEGLGILKKQGKAVKEGETAYTVFGSRGLIFPLVDKENNIVNYFAQRFELESPTEEYLNMSGLYPSYPAPKTRRLFITPTLMDAASLVQSNALEQADAALALHEGKLLQQHIETIKELRELEEIIIIKR